jgi:hypothetical protein
MFLPPKWRGLITNDAARQSSVSTGEKITCLPGAGRRDIRARYWSCAWLAVRSK